MSRDASEAVVGFEVNASETAVKSKEEGSNKTDPVPVSPLAHGPWGDCLGGRRRKFWKVASLAI